MTIVRQGLQNFSGASGTLHYYSTSYDPGYPGTEKGTIIFFAVRNSFGGGALIDYNQVFYGSVRMRMIAGDLINNALGTTAIFYVVNPPKGTQTVTFNTIGGAIRAIIVRAIAYYSDSAPAFRVFNYNRVLTSTNSLLDKVTAVSKVASGSWVISASYGFDNNAAPQLQTTTFGTPLIDRTSLNVNDSNGVVALGAQDGIGVTVDAISGGCRAYALSFSEQQRSTYLLLPGFFKK